MYSAEKTEAFIRSRERAVLDKITKQSSTEYRDLNLFEIISDIYHRENLHSDVLKAILESSRFYSDKVSYLVLFMNFLSKNMPLELNFMENQVNINIVREEGRRDITIQYGNCAILIENKINDAGDTNNQIPTYYYQLKENGKDIRAIIYLTLNQGKEPDRKSWKFKSEEDRADVEKKLICIRVFDGTKKDLINGWLNPCIEKTVNPNNKAVLLQYQATLQKLALNLLDMEYMQQFELMLNQGNNYDIARAIQNDMAELKTYIGLSFKEYFSKNEKFLPFNGIRMYSGNLFPFLEGYRIGGYAFNSDVIFDYDQTTIDFSIRNENQKYTKEIPELVLATIEMKDEFTWNDTGRFVKTINEPMIKAKEIAINFTEGFLERLTKKNHELKLSLGASQ